MKKINALNIEGKKIRWSICVRGVPCFRGYFVRHALIRKLFLPLLLLCQNNIQQFTPTPHHVQGRKE